MDTRSLPLVTCIMCAYNQERFIAEAVKSVLNQDYSNMEIIISDDCSSDRTFDIISDIVKDYNGPHRIILNRNEKNLGIREHHNLLNKMSHGEIIMGAAGDDISLPTRASAAVEVFLKHPEVMSLSCEVDIIDEEGNPLSAWEHHIRKGDYALLTLTEYIHFRDFYLYPGASRIYRREVIEKFPAFTTAPDEDVYLFIRSLYLGSIAFIHQPLLKYRRHNTSITALREKEGGANRLKREREMLKSASEHQLYSDLEYAIEKGYLDPKFRPHIQEKIGRIYDCYISPINNYIPRWKYVVVKPIKYLLSLLGLRMIVVPKR